MATDDPKALRATLQRATLLAAHAPVPARLGNVLAGTAGWTDPSLIKSGKFYPRGVSSAEERLKYYASRFSLVEVDSSYYALPSVANVQRWVERTPEDFVFDVKAFAGMTGHPIDVHRLPLDLQRTLPADLLTRKRIYPRDLPESVLEEIWKRFERAIEPLYRANKLGCVLFQFPPWFDATRRNVKTIQACRSRMENFPLAVEFRHASWGDPSRFERVIELLRDLKISYVCVDEPQGTPHSMPPEARVADPRLAVVRFHGRRRETWDTGASVHEKFDYLYDPDELVPWISNVRQLSSNSEKVHLVFNNCVSNYAVLGALDIMALLTAQRTNYEQV